jgi:DNA-directed RNA polymerase specialized sigma24 family protein
MVDQQTAEEAQAQLLHRVAAQDAQALAELYDLTAKPLFSLALRILGDVSEAEEVI